MVSVRMHHRIAVLGVLLIGLSACGGFRTGARAATPVSPEGVPRFSVPPGTYASAQTVTIFTDTPQAAIFYTTDGSDPSFLSRVYEGPVLVSSSLTLKALALSPNSSSGVASAKYSFNSNYRCSDGLPVPARSSVPKPAGQLGRLKVLDWAGFGAAISYTLDDSMASQVAAYPQLQATGERMTFFLVSGMAINSTIWAQVAKDGHEIGNHTHHHCLADGTHCGVGSWSGSIGAEYDECTDYIKQVLYVDNVWTTAAPFGDTRYDSVALTRFFLNRGVGQGHIAPNDDTDPNHLPTYAPKPNETATTLNAHVDAARAGGYWEIYELHSLKANEGYAPVDITDLIANIDYAKSKGDVWIDSMVNVGAYWVGQRALSDAKYTESHGSVVVSWTLPQYFPSGKYLRITLSGGTLKQGGVVIPWNDAGFYEVALDPGSLTISE